MKAIKKISILLRLISICGLAWALCSDMLISRLASPATAAQQEYLRIGNNILWFGATMAILNRQIQRQQRSLRDSEQQYRELFSGNPNPMWIYDNLTLRFVMVN